MSLLVATKHPVNQLASHFPNSQLAQNHDTPNDQFLDTLIVPTMCRCDYGMLVIYKHDLLDTESIL